MDNMITVLPVYHVQKNVKLVLVLPITVQLVTKTEFKVPNQTVHVQKENSKLKMSVMPVLTDVIPVSIKLITVLLVGKTVMIVLKTDTKLQLVVVQMDIMITVPTAYVHLVTINVPLVLHLLKTVNNVLIPE